MQSSDLQALWIIAALCVFFGILVVVKLKRSKKVREQLEIVAREMGWSEVRSSIFPAASVRGIWNGHSVRIHRLPEGKTTPERIETNIRVQTAGRLAVTRRGVGIFANKPLPLFGTPLVDLPQYSDLWICADEITFAERLMNRIAAALERLLLGEGDFLRMGGDKLTVRSSKNSYALLAREELERMRAAMDAGEKLTDLNAQRSDEIARLARAQLELLRAVIECS